LPFVLSQGTLITVVGLLQGSETRLIGEMPYIYPVVDVTEIKKWEPEKHIPPRFQIGIGIGGRL
jgi:starvation-inducible outer membrane lipoprotein